MPGRFGAALCKKGKKKRPGAASIRNAFDDVPLGGTGQKKKGTEHMNVVILTGRLTADIELRHTQQGTPCTNFNLAVDRASKDDTADFPTIVAWDKTALFLSEYMRKGSKIVVRGEIRTRNYNDSDGKSRKITEVVADRVEFADSKTQGPFA